MDGTAVANERKVSVKASVDDGCSIICSSCAVM